MQTQGLFSWSLPLANRLEKSVSVRLKRASPPTLSQESCRFLAARSLKEVTILLLSSRLLFFCKNPKRLQEEEESAGWLHFPYMLAAAAFFLLFINKKNNQKIKPRPLNKSLLSSFSFSLSLLYFLSRYLLCDEEEKKKGPIPLWESYLWAERGPCGRLRSVTSASNSSQAQTHRCHVAAVNS